MGGDFSGEVAGFYARYRRGYQPAFTDLLVQALRLSGDDVVADLGCGTGQLTLPLASRARAVAGVDPEPDMLALAWQAAQDQDQRAAFAGHIRAFTGPGPRFTEHVHVAALIGYAPG